MKMYWLPYCTTCQKAAEYLQTKGVEVAEFCDVKTARLSRDEVARLANLAGGAEALFSRRAMKYRRMNLGARELSDDDLLDLMTEEYTFIRRPVLVRDGRAVAGFTPKTYDRFLSEGRDAQDKKRYF
jgi:arsenate reductase